MKISLPTQILTSIGLAIFCGVFFGEWMGVLEPVGRAFILLLKMSILPYIMFALMFGLGSLHPSQAGRLLKYGGIFLLVIWAMVFATIIGLRFSFPPLTGMLYYSAAPAHEVPPQPLIDLFIPGNIFDALSKNIVPAVVLFSLFFGAALMVLNKKETALHLLDTITKALSRITRWVIQLSPIGVFALVASTVGTISFYEFEKIAIYLATFFIAALFLTFWALPLLLSSLTNISYKELLSNLREGLLLGFATGNIFVTLPYIMDAIDHISSKREIQTQEAHMISKTIVPIAYNLPLVGNLLAALFILFITYYYGIDLTLTQKIMFIPSTLLTLAGPVTAGLNSIAFMITEMNLPQPGIALFVETLSVTRNFQALAGSMGITIFTLLTLFAFTKQIRFQLKKMLIFIGSTFVLFVGIVLTLYFVEPVPRPPPAPFPNFKIDSPIKAKVYTDTLPEPAPDEPVMERVRKTLRVGYWPDAPPFSYFNQDGELVGYDIAYAYALAEALQTELVFIPFKYDKLAEELDDRLYDIGMSTISVHPDRLEEMLFSDPTAIATHVFVVLDKDRKTFADKEKVEKMKGLRIGVLSGATSETLARREFPNATIVPLNEAQEMLDNPNIDAFLWTNVEALTWVKLHPTYTIVETVPPLPKDFYAYPMVLEADEFADFVNYFIQLQTLNGFQEAQHKKWIMGETKNPPQRWSIIRNILHWVD